MGHVEPDYEALREENERLRRMLRKAADLMQHGPAWEDERTLFAWEIEKAIDAV